MDSLEVKAQKYKDQLSAYRRKITICEAQITQLTKQVEDLRKKEKELEVFVLASTKDLINLEAHDRIKHVKAAHQLDSKTEELKF